MTNAAHFNNENSVKNGSADISNTEQYVAASNECIKFNSVNDVLCGHGDGTNFHPGNHHFLNLVNANCRAYLNAKKNDKPAISCSIMGAICEMNGLFLKTCGSK